jgi:carbamoyltransferase
MNILGIYWGTCSTAALMIDGQIIACVSEERFSRKKNDDSYPLNAIDHVLRVSAVKPSDIDIVAFTGHRFDVYGVLTHKYSNFSVMDRLMEQKKYWYPKIIQGKDVSYLDVFAAKIDDKQYPGNWDKVIDFLRNSKGDLNEFLKEFRQQVVVQHLGIDKHKIIFTDHHRAHSYYAYYGSPLAKEKTVILTAEAWGDDKNASVCIADNGNIQMLASSIDFIVARLYRHITLLLGMKPDEHEYKVMGLAAYAKEKYIKEPLAILKNTMYVRDLGFAFHETPPDLYFYFKDKLDGYRFDSIAGAIQKYTEDILVQWAENALKLTGAKRCVLSGGVAMNIKAIMEVSALKDLEEIFICPSPSDESLAMGSAYVAMHDICVDRGQNPASYLKPLADSYLGPAETAEEVKKTISKATANGFHVMETPSPAYIAEILDKGLVIGRCVGRSEFGARALGNRSIIADPRRLQIVKIINEKIKSRDFWMPFSPSIISERAADYLLNPKNIQAPYMTVAFHTKQKAWSDLAAALHQADLTVRPQIVESNMNKEYHAIIEAFYKKTGVGGVLNTSFNVHGEPIVQTSDDAFDVFQRTELDALLLDGYLIETAPKDRS